MSSSNGSAGLVPPWPFALAVGLAAGAVGCAIESRSQEPAGASAASPLTVNAVTLESRDGQGRQGNLRSVAPSISGNQRFVVFASDASSWAPGVDTNGASDIYRKDRSTGAITLVSAAGVVVGNGGSFDASVSDTGKVAFVTDATNLAPGATGPYASILVSASGVNARVDLAPDGSPNGGSSRPQISGDGNFVVFQSDATNLVPGDTNGATDIFVRDLRTSELTRVSVAGGLQANGRSYDASISFDGRYVAFTTDASNLRFNDGNGVSDVYVHDRATASTYPASFSTTGMGGALGDAASDRAQISGDGQHVAFRSFSVWDSGDTNGTGDIFVKDFAGGGANFPHRVSVSTSGAAANGLSWQSAISYDGSAVAFASSATNLVDGEAGTLAGVFVRNRSTGQTIRADQRDPQTSANGSVLLASTLRFSGNPGQPSWSFLVFDSQASNLVWSDANAAADVFSASLSL